MGMFGGPALDLGERAAKRTSSHGGEMTLVVEIFMYCTIDELLVNLSSVSVKRQKQQSHAWARVKPCRR